MSTRRSWVAACTGAEALGMTAAATAARAAELLPTTATRLALVVLGGLVEGAALGVLQGRALPVGHDAAARRRWALVTLVVAGLGWAAASAPSAAAAPGGATGQPPWLLVLAGAAVLGAVMGLGLGAAQAAAAGTVAGGVRRWAGWSCAGWAAAMPVVFVGATGVGADWSWPALLAAGAATGVAAGLVLGLVTAGAASRLAPRPRAATAPRGATPPRRPTGRRVP